MSGVSASLVWFACLRGPQEWFSKRRGLAVGITMAASGVGGLVFSNVASACFENLDYRWALRILGFMQLVLIAIAACTSWRLNPPAKNVPFIDFQDWKNKKFIIHFFVHFIGNFAFYVSFTTRVIYPICSSFSCYTLSFSRFPPVLYLLMPSIWVMIV